MKSNKRSQVLTQEQLIQSKQRILNDKTPYAFKEAYVRLRTNMMFGLAAGEETGCKVISITSPNPGEGKTTTALNVAISFAMLGKKTLLIDADMRRPQVNRLLGVSSQDGLSNLLAGVGECYINTIEEYSLDFITSGKNPPNPAELLSANIASKLEKLKAQYDYIIIDTPPVNSVADAQIIAPHADGIAIVVHMGTTKAPELMHAEDVLINSGGKIIGIIANDMELKSKSYGRYGRSYYGRSYYGIPSDSEDNK